ncbi:MAG: hypothetical protein KBC00_01015 [Candidatus Levybacteria bacterium]|nr:hypothetical protein [Candidatus Levybacteria bacterium]MBP9814770.1 hypothetical protein [Candidatus Levybacteria bacterium]
MFLPQVIQVFKTKDTKSISLTTFVLLNLNSFTWIVYGILIKSNPVILVNSVILILGLYITTMKVRHK